MTTEIPMLNVQIDGVWLQFPKGTRVIEACRQADKFIPHYCYHPKLSSPGNCRMCMVEMGTPRMGPDRKPITDPDGRPEINWIPRPQISCAQDVSEGMAIRTESPMVTECRNGVMEFLLINHPLDCPICDQAGECKLQEFSVDFGKGGSRFLEPKVKKPKNVELGPRVTLDDERCILCSRCIRFMREVAHDDVLGFTERGSYSTLSCHPDRMLDSNYSLNTVDICPVGALTSNDFRFKMRVWFLKETKSICTTCGTGCNTLIATRENTLYRQTPRDNEDVNQGWMCDRGRLDFHRFDPEHRLLHPLVASPDGPAPATWEEALAAAAARIRSVQATGKPIAVIGSGRLTNEELHLVGALAELLDAPTDIVPRPQAADDILVCNDGNPNTHGAILLGVAARTPGIRLGDIAAGVRDGSIGGLLLIGEDATACGLVESDLAALDALIILDSLPNPSTKHAHVLLPGAAPFEKRGSMINVNGRLQRLNRATPPPGSAREDWEILRDLHAALTGSPGATTIEEVFRDLAKEVPSLAGLSLGRIGDLGTALPLAATPLPVPAAPISAPAA